MVGTLPVPPLVAEAQEAQLGSASVEASGKDSYSCAFGKGPIEAAMGGLACFGYYVMKFASWIAIVAGILLNESISRLIVGMADFVHPDGPGGYSAVEETWKVIRDLTNVFLVFLTVFIGIATIVGISGYGYKQLLWKVILAAIFVNFSITLAYFVIDIGNYFAVSMYTTLLQQAGMDVDEARACVRATTGDLPEDCRTKGVAGAYVDLFSMSKLLNPELITSDSVRETWWRQFLVFMSGSVFFLVLAFVFLAGAFLFIGRFVILIALIIASPIGLVLWITQVSSLGRKWWSMLINQTLIAPLLLLFWLISFIVLKGFLRATGEERLGSMVHALETVSGFDIILVFVIGIGFLVGSIMAAKALGAAGASRAMGLGKAAAVGTGVMIGAGGMRLASRVPRAMGRSYEASQAKLMETDADGKYVKKGAYANIRRKMVGGRLDRATSATLNAGARASFFGSKSLEQREKEKKDNTNARKRYLDQKLVENTAASNAAKARAPGLTRADRRHAAEQVQRLNADQLASVVNKGKSVDPNIARTMSAAQMKQLEERTDVDRERIQQIQRFRSQEALQNVQIGAAAVTPAARQQAIQDAARNIRNMSETERRTLARESSDSIRNGTMNANQAGIMIESMTPTDVAHMDVQVLTRTDPTTGRPDIAGYLRPEHLRAMDTRNELSVPERQQLAAAIRAASAGGAPSPALRYISDPRRVDLWT